MKPRAKLYLLGSSADQGKSVQCSQASSIIIFVTHYCRTRLFDLVFIADSSVEFMPCEIKTSHFSDLNITFKSLSEVPNLVRNVELPSVHQPEISLVRCGLCVVLRHIVKEAHKDAPDKHLIDLLGFRQGSMRMCAEVSSWTKLCEVELALSLSELIATLRELEIPDHDSAEKELATISLPSPLVRLENYFQQKCKIHNDDKKRRAELVRLKEHLSHCSQISSSSHELQNAAGENRPSDDECTNSILNKQPSDIGNVNNSSVQTVNKVNHADSASQCKLSRLSNVCVERLSYQERRLEINQVVLLHHGVRKVKVDKSFDNDPLQKISALKTSGDTDIAAKDMKPKDSAGSWSHGYDVDKSLSSQDIMELVDKLNYLDIEFVHAYSEGYEMTLADLVLFVYIYHLLESLHFFTVPLASHLPSTLKWAGHMNSLALIKEAGEKCGWHMAGLAACLEIVMKDNSSHVGSLNKPEKCPLVTFVKEPLVVEVEEDTDLSRCMKSKCRAIKPEVLQTLNKFESACIKPQTGDHPCGDEVQIDWMKLPPEVNPIKGDVPLARIQRKCQQLENLGSAVQAVTRPGDIIVDFCSGGGHLGILLACLMPENQVYLVENKEESLLKACERLEALNLSNVTLYQCNLSYFVGKFSVGVCLHACGSATDMVMQKCLDSQASFVICPCCYGSIKKTHLMTYPRSQQFMQTNITYKDFLTLGHAADQTEFNIALEEQGRQCMGLVDTDRAQYARESGYTVTLCSLKPLSCTPKNNLLVGTCQ